MHRKYIFFNENASSPNISCGSWDITFVVHFGSPHITFWIPMIVPCSTIHAHDVNLVHYPQKNSLSEKDL